MCKLIRIDAWLKFYTREHWIQRITFAAETNAANSRGSADTHTDAERHDTFSDR